MVRRRRIAPLTAIALVVVAAAAGSTTLEPKGGSEGRIAFVSTRDGSTEIYVMNEDGSEQTRLTAEPAEDLSPAWAPDGKRVAFASNRSGNWEIYTMDVRGRDIKRLTEDPAFDGAPSWSPDGARIAFASSRDGNSEIYVMNADGTGQTRLTRDPADDAMPRWAPDDPECAVHAGAIAFESDRDRDYDIYAVDPDAGSPPVDLTRSSAHEFNAAWAPDCSAIAFDRPSNGNYDVYVLELATRVETRVTSDDADDSRPAWSPAGDAIAFSSLRDGHYEIYVADARSGRITNLSLSSPRSDVQPAWHRAAAAAPTVVLRPPRLLAGGSGSVRLTGRALTCTVEHFRRRLRGTESGDIICSPEGTGQIVLARPGDDVIIDTGGRDVIYGGRGRDVIYARDGSSDVIWGGPSVDEINIDRGLDAVRRPTGDAIIR